MLIFPSQALTFVLTLLLQCLAPCESSYPNEAACKRTCVSVDSSGIICSCVHQCSLLSLFNFTNWKIIVLTSSFFSITEKLEQLSGQLQFFDQSKIFVFCNNWRWFLAANPSESICYKQKLHLYLPAVGGCKEHEWQPCLYYRNRVD